MRSIITILITLAALPASAAHKHHTFECKELRGLPHLSRAYQDTLEACIWDYRHPNKSDIVR